MLTVSMLWKQHVNLTLEPSAPRKPSGQRESDCLSSEGVCRSHGIYLLTSDFIRCNQVFPNMPFVVWLSQFSHLLLPRYLSRQLTLLRDTPCHSALYPSAEYFMPKQLVCCASLPACRHVFTFSEQSQSERSQGRVVGRCVFTQRSSLTLFANGSAQVRDAGKDNPQLRGVSPTEKTK